MKKSRTLLIVLLAGPALSLYAYAIPETAVTRTHLMKDINQSSITAGVGIDFYWKDSYPAYDGDILFGYFGYAPSDWLEFGISVHLMGLYLCPFVEAKIDLVDIFTDSSRLSCMLMGGIGTYTDDEVRYPIYHGGLAMNFRLNQYLQLYLGAGSDSISEALTLQAGAYISLLKWLGISMNFELVTGPEGTAPMISIAPLATFKLDKRE